MTKNWMLRPRLPHLTKAQLTNKIGVNTLDTIMTIMGWKGGPNGKELDDDKLDCTYRKLRTIIDIQLKSRSLAEKRKCWGWEIIAEKQKIDKSFYDNRFSFLALVGIKLDAIFEDKTEKFPQVALIPGKAVVKYFTEIAPKSRIITLYLKKLLEGNYPEWNCYFGENNIRKLLAETLFKGEEEEDRLELWDKQDKGSASL